MEFDVTSDRVAIGGPVGAGKSTVVDAVRFVLLQNTRMGSKDLARFSDSGQWTASVRIGAGKAMTTFTAGVSPRGAIRAVDGIAVPAPQYAASLNTILMPGDTTDMGTFLALSDRNRSEMIGDLLGNKPGTLLQAIQEATDSPDQTLQSWWGSTKPLVDGEFSGSPNELSDYLRKTATSFSGELKTRQNELQELLDKDVGEVAAESVSDLEAKMGRLQQELGGIQAEITDAESRNRARKAAQETIDKLNTRLAALKVTEKGLSDQRAFIHSLDKETAVLQKSFGLAEKQHELARDAAARDRHMPEALQAFAARVRAGEFNDKIPDGWQAVEVAGFVSECADAIIAKASTTATNVAGTKQTLDQCRDKLEKHAKKVGQAKTTYSQSEADAARIPALEADIVRFAQSAQEMTASTDVEAATAKKTAKETEISAIRATLTSARDAKENADRIMGLRKTMASDVAKGDRLKELSAVVTAWRDKRVGAAAQGMMGTVSERLAKLIPGASIEVGNTKGLSLMVRRGKKLASVDDLSDGETVLFSAAMLPAIQRGPAKLITLNTEALDAPTLGMLLKAKGWADFTLVANNRLERGVAEAEGWQVVMLQNGRIA